MFTGGNTMNSMQADVAMNISDFSGSVMLVYHVQNARNYDFLALENGIQRTWQDGGRYGANL